MRITIDTKEDSPEDIKKVLQILHHLTDKNAVSNYEQPKEQVDTTNMMNMFDSKPDTEGTPPNFDALLSLGKKEEEKRDEPKVELF